MGDSGILVPIHQPRYSIMERIAGEGVIPGEYICFYKLWNGDHVNSHHATTAGKARRCNLLGHSHPPASRLRASTPPPSIFVKMNMAGTNALFRGPG